MHRYPAIGTPVQALWRPETVSQIFVTFAQADAIGLSSVAGLLCPVSRRAAHGLRIDLAPAETAVLTLQAPIAPGLVAPVGVAEIHEISPGEPQSLRIPRGVIALDGEREIEFQSDQQVILRLDLEGPFTIDIERVMTKAAQDGLLVARRHWNQEGELLMVPTTAPPRMKMPIPLHRRGAGLGCPEPGDPPRRLTPSAPPERGF